MTQKPQALLFDWDNTLVDSWVCIQESYNMTFRQFGMAEWTMEDIKANVAKSMRDSFPQMFGDRWEEAGRLFSENFAAIHLSHLRPLPGVVHMLDRLSAQGIYLGVVSNKRGHFLRKEAAALGWDRYFQQLIGAQDAEQDKPAIAPVHLALTPSGLQPGSHVWFVGDSPIDMHCAHASGCTGILLRQEPPVEDGFRQFPPHYHFHDCDELLGLAL